MRLVTLVAPVGKFAKIARLAVAVLTCLSPFATAFAHTSPPPASPAPSVQAAPLPAEVAPNAAPAPVAPATPAPPLVTKTSRQLDQVDAALAQIETAFQNRDVSTKDLKAFHDEIAPFTSHLQTTLDHLNGVLAAVKARLDQLGPAPAAKAPAESAQITKERQQQQQEFEAIDALVKRAKLLLVRVTQVNARIAEHQRATFTHSLFRRGPSVAEPGLWLDVVAETPHNFKMARNAVGDWFARVDNRLPGWRTALFWALALAAFALYWPASLLARRGRGPTDASPSQFRKIVAAWRVVLIVAAGAVAPFFVIAGLSAAFGIYDAFFRSAFLILLAAVLSVAVADGLGRGVLAPGNPDWRLLTLRDARYAHTRMAMVVIAALVMTGHLILALCESIGTDQMFQAAVSGLVAFCVAIAIVAALWRGGEVDCDAILGPRVTATRDWYGPLRILLWIVTVAIFAAVLAGFMGLASFLADQVLWVGFVGLVAMMGHTLVEEAIAAGCRPTTPFGRALNASSGLSPVSIEQLAILLSGATTVVIFVTAILLILAPWGIQSTDLPTYFHDAFFGFHVGDITVSLASIIVAVAIFVVGITTTRTVGGWIESRFLPHTRLDLGLRNAIRTSFGYLGFILALGFCLAYLGLNFEKLAIVAGALSVGIGFGLQSIVNNFVSGLILLWERAIRVGDWIVVGSDEGLVRRINVRSTEIQTFDCAAVVVPNANLVAGVVKNYVRTDRSGRVMIAIPVNAAADPEQARDILLDIAKGHKLVVARPAPSVIFAGITASAYNFELYCFVADIATLGTVKSDLNFEIYRRFKAEGLFAAPPPASVVTLAGLDRFETLLDKVVGSASQDEAPERVRRKS